MSERDADMDSYTYNDQMDKWMGHSRKKRLELWFKQIELKDWEGKQYLELELVETRRARLDCWYKSVSEVSVGMLSRAGETQTDWMKVFWEKL